MKRLHVKKNRIIHVSVRRSKSILSKTSQSSNLTINSSKIPNYRSQSVQTNDTWANPSDYTKTLVQNKKKKKKYIRQRNIIVSTVTLLLVTALFITLLIILLRKSNNKTKYSGSLPVLQWNRTGITIAGATGQPGNVSNRLNHPFGLYIDWSNALYIADHFNNRIQKYLKDATFGETVAGDATAIPGSTSKFLDHPSHIVVDLYENIYVSDRYNTRVQLWKKDALNGSTIAGITGLTGNASDRFQYPYGITHDLVNNVIYVADYGNDRVMSYRVGIKNGTIVAGGNGRGMNAIQLRAPMGIRFDKISNSILIANHLANNVVRWKLGDFNWSLVAGDLNGATSGASNMLCSPADVVLDPMNNMYVVDLSNARVQLFLDNASNGSTIAGITGTTGSNASLFNWPISVALDSQLNLYVSDYLNERVQKFLRY